MSEKKQQIHVLIKLLVVVVCCGLYSWGGIEHKWLRRFLMPLVYTLTMYAYSRDWRCFIQLPLMCLTLSTGYGVNSKFARLGRLIFKPEIFVKCFARFVYGLLNGFSFSTYNIICKKPLVWIFGVIMAILGSVYLGVFNPTTARVEETLICLFFSWQLLTTGRAKEGR